MKHRWSGRLETTSSIIKNYDEICRLLQSVCAGTVIRDGDTIVDARGLLRVVQVKLFCFNTTVLAKLILNLISPADKALQARKCNLAEALRLYHSL